MQRLSGVGRTAPFVRIGTATLAEVGDPKTTPLTMRGWARVPRQMLPKAIVSQERPRCPIKDLSVCLMLIVLLTRGRNTPVTRQRQAEENADRIYRALFVPPDATLLGKVEQSDLLAYARGCTGTVSETAFRVLRPMSEILDEYQEPLLRSGWEKFSGSRRELGHTIY